jgi:hypothetical protein
MQAQAQSQAANAQSTAALMQGLAALQTAGANLGKKPPPRSRTIDCDTRPVGIGTTTSCAEN